jgi:SNF2 family DNA or RNA helicase
MSNAIKVTYDQKTKRLVMSSGFHMADVMREYPSRRFNPKDKTWRMPIVKANLTHFLETRHKYDYELDPLAIGAMMEHESLMAGPTYKLFPEVHLGVMNKTPMDHQWNMLNKGWNLNAYALFAAMGTGKTYTTIATALVRWKLGQIDRLAIICPATLRRTWEKEFKKHSSKDFVDFRYHDTADKSMPGWAMAPNKQLKVLAISVEGLGISEKMYDAACAFFTGPKTMVVCDESSRIKNPDAKRTERSIALATCATYRVILNGTPIAKGIHDLWAQYEFLDPNIIGTGDYWAFKTRYLVMGGFENRQIVGYTKVEELMNLVTPYSLEVPKSLLKLPPKVFKTLHVEASPEQRRLFDKILTGIGTGHISVQNVLERMLRLQQVIGGFEPMTDIDTEITTTKPLEKNPKMDALLDLLEDHREGSKFIIWARYIPEIEAIVAALRQKYGAAAVVSYYGATSAEDRTIAEDRYCNDPTCRFLVGNPSAAGLGLTFISGESDVMVYYSGTFAYIDRSQSEDRSHRIGQANTVTIVDFVMTKTLDEAIIAAIRDKKDMDQFVKDWINKGGDVTKLMKGIEE